jgi:hypothetical protein
MVAIRRTDEFRRVSALPRRQLSLATAEAWAAALTPMLALDNSVSLRPWQAQCLAELVSCGGCWAALPVGQGKTLISWLAPVALAAERSLLVIPGALVDKTRLDFAYYAEHWRAPMGAIRMVTREWLATQAAATFLDDYAPDLITIDEADDLSNPKSSAVLRLDRYIIKQLPACPACPACRVLAMSGTPSRKSIMGYWHQLCWCLGDRAPVPENNAEASLWALALDTHDNARPDYSVLGPNLPAARAWFRSRLISTPGVLVIDEDSCKSNLTVRIRLAPEDAAIDAAFKTFLTEFENPGGIPVSDPLVAWLLDGQLGLGLYSVWDPAPPQEWREARRSVARFVRERIDASQRSSRPLDTEAQVLRAYEGHDVVRNWATVKPTFAGATKVVWFSDSTLTACKAWLAESDEPGIVWTGCVDFGQRLARETGLQYYGQAGRTDTGVGLHAAPADASIVSSWKANKKGFNLQAWARQLIAMPPQSAKWLEQIFGRSHRSGQESDVCVDILATSGGTLDSFDAAIDEARGIRDREAMTQKLLRATIQRPEMPAAPSFRWARRRDK